MFRHLIRGATVFLLFYVIASTTVLAIDGPPGGRMGPPPEAVEACKEKNEGENVKITTPRGEQITATCRQMSGQLVAIPDGRFRGSKELSDRQQTGE